MISEQDSARHEATLQRRRQNETERNLKAGILGCFLALLHSGGTQTMRPVDTLEASPGGMSIRLLKLMDDRFLRITTVPSTHLDAGDEPAVFQLDILPGNDQDNSSAPTFLDLLDKNDTDHADLGQRLKIMQGVCETAGVLPVDFSIRPDTYNL